MLRSRLLPLLAVVAAACSDAALAPLTAPDARAAHATAGTGKLIVTSSADSGAGSLREAIAAASADPSIEAIRVGTGVGVIVPQSPIVYSGTQPLDFDGAGRTIDASAAGGTGLTFIAHQRVRVRNVAVVNAADVGVAVLVPSAASGVVSIDLDSVTVSGNAGHGVLINDQAEYLADPNSTANTGSDASLDVTLRAVRSLSNGFSALDRDGIRINEGGAGDLLVRMKALTVHANGGDGIELDERGDGTVDFTVQQTTLLANGAYSAEDYDDGIDVDEMDAGDLRGRFTDVIASENLEQGVDLNENHAGDLVVTMTGVRALGNKEEGIEFEEDDDFAGSGHILATLVDIIASGNGANDGDAGLKVREKGEGSVDVTMSKVTAIDNAIGGVLVREDAAGDLVAALRGITASRNGGHGVQFDENGNGVLSGRLTLATTVDNTGAGVQAEQATSGTGTLLVAALSAAGNTLGDLVANAAQVTVTRLP